MSINLSTESINNIIFESIQHTRDQKESRYTNNHYIYIYIYIYINEENKTIN